MIRYSLFLFLLISSTEVFSQRIDERGVFYHEGVMPGYCLDCGHSKARFNGTEKELRKFITKRIDNKLLRKYRYKGEIIVHVLVDTLGNPRCTNIDNNPKNNSQESIVALNLDKTISEMPKWTVATEKNGFKSNSSVLIMVDFSSDVPQVNYFDLGGLIVD